MLTRKSLIGTSLLIITSLILNACVEITPAVSLVITDTPLPTKPTSTATITPIPFLIDIQPESLQGITIEVASAFVGLSQTAFNDTLARFNTFNEWGITVYPIEYDSYNTLYTEVSEALINNDPPDFVITLPEQILSWDEDTEIVVLDNYLQDPRYGLSQEDIDDFTPIFSQLAGFDESDVISLPAEISTPLLFYNRTWGMELGFNEAPTTFEQFRQQACAANEFFKADGDQFNDGYGGWVVNSTPASILAWMHAFDGSLMDSGSLFFSSENNISAIQSLKSLYDDNCAWISNARNHYQALAERNALFITADLTEVADQVFAYDSAKNQDEWTIIPFPGNHTSLVAEGPEVAIIAGNPEENLASWLFIRWMLSAESQIQWTSTTGIIPIRSSVIDELDAYGVSHPVWAQIISFMDELTLQPRVSEWRYGRLILGDATEYIFRMDLEPEQIPGIFEQMDATIQELTKP